ncbi:SpoIIE family protein phosphatase (plasmid) [Sphingomonas changnyeongensis]|uniref:SpoIIE family protein phosphatase n=1 Tax=Sphingomonas changnyeongensis TaxID=2698679 RepID=A0A7Z2NY97_9SPHN|nr:protein phosphatase 2C domain-containing protein [Sphingomonas changnyeongensis]QHL92045.1 SpoIIE family protein phosphatase [Sphingomonas changnyeongensis]
MQAFAWSHVGLIRSINEDIIALEGWNSRDSPEGRLAHPRTSSWALIADGMGGHAAGETASELATMYLSELLPVATNRAQIEKALAAIHLRLHEIAAAHAQLAGMGTTIVGVLQQGSSVMMFNVGDSRLYRLRRGVLEMLSEDDSVGHALTQCLGGYAPEPLPVAHVSECVLEEGDRLLLCSDGLTDMVDDDAIAGILSASHEDPAHMLVVAALEAGGYDNVSVVVLL